MHGETIKLLYQDLRRTNNRKKLLLFVRSKSWYSAVSLGLCSLSPSRVGLRTYQHHGNTEIYRKSGSIFKQRFYLEGQDLNLGTEAGKLTGFKWFACVPAGKRPHSASN